MAQIWPKSGAEIVQQLTIILLNILSIRVDYSVNYFLDSSIGRLINKMSEIECPSKSKIKSSNALLCPHAKDI